ncbi:MAG: hypothetical protein ACXVZV_15680 [Terriglobales bacterium]
MLERLQREFWIVVGADLSARKSVHEFSLVSPFRPEQITRKLKPPRSNIFHRAIGQEFRAGNDVNVDDFAAFVHYE